MLNFNYVLSVYFMVIIMFSWVWIPIYWLLKKTIFKIEMPLVKTDSVNYNKTLLLISLLISIVLRIIQYLYSKGAYIGPDALSYVNILEAIRMDPINMFKSIERWTFLSYLITFLLVFPLKLIGIGWNYIFMVVNLIYSVLLICGVYYFMKNASTSDNTAGLASLFCSFSLIFLTITTSYFKNVFALIILFFNLTFIIKYFENNEKKDLILLFLTTIILFIQYYVIVIFLTIVYILSILIYIFIDDLSSIKMMKIFLSIYGFLLIISITVRSRTFLLLNHIISRDDFGYYPNSFNPLTWINLFQSSNWYKYFVESNILTFMSIIGIIILIENIISNKNIILKKTYSLTLILYLISISIVFPFTLSEKGESYRLVLNYPFGIFAAVGMNYLLNLIDKINIKITIDNSKNIDLILYNKYKKIILSIIILLFALRSGYLNVTSLEGPFAVRSLPKEELQGIYWIRDNFENENIILLVKPIAKFIPIPPQMSNVRWIKWAEAILVPGIKNVRIYDGNLFDLTEGKPPKFSKYFSPVTKTFQNNFNWDLSNNRVFIVDGLKSGTFYSLDNIEKQVLKKVHPFVYELRKDLNNETLSFWKSLWGGQSFNSEISVISTLQYNETNWKLNRGNGLLRSGLWTFIFDTNSSYMWIEQYLNSSNTSEIKYVVARVKLNGHMFASLDILDSTRNRIFHVKFRERHEDWKTFIIELPDSLKLDEDHSIAFVFERTSNVDKSVQIDFIIFILK